MANMSIGSVMLDSNPSACSLIKADKSCSLVQTYSGAAFFSWGTVLQGKEIELRWEYMRETDFAALDALMDDAGTVVFDPQDGSGKSYNVWLISLDGEYYLALGDGTSSSVFRRNVVLVMAIESVVS
ncbi:MAG: hypothetical protein BWY06_01238 [Candidatus Latescibacteria bacterium ADurb.Bin168]|nr:MAG: hypothetical protein BWY06_01238 [Candidatus Latescibacteria bacterium ADurb.Bin168]